MRENLKADGRAKNKAKIKRGMAVAAEAVEELVERGIPVNDVVVSISPEGENVVSIYVQAVPALMELKAEDAMSCHCKSSEEEGAVMMRKTVFQFMECTVSYYEAISPLGAASRVH